MASPLTNLDLKILIIKDNFNVLSKIITRQGELVLKILRGELHYEDEDVRQSIQMNETVIDSLEVKIRNEVMNAIVLYTPRARDSRRMFAYIDITGYLERVGDLLCNVADHAKSIAYACDICEVVLPRLTDMLQSANKMVADSIIAFTVLDAELSREIIRKDNDIDREYARLLEDLPFLIDSEGNPTIIRTALALSSISYNIERIGDNATNVAEAAIFNAEGFDIRHHTKEIREEDNRSEEESVQ